MDRSTSVCHHEHERRASRPPLSPFPSSSPKGRRERKNANYARRSHKDGKLKKKIPQLALVVMLSICLPHPVIHISKSRSSYPSFPSTQKPLERYYTQPMKELEKSAFIYWRGGEKTNGKQIRKEKMTPPKNEIYGEQMFPR